MHSFKPKPNKRMKYNKTSVTLDNTHKDFLQEFAKDFHEKIPKLKIEKSKLKTKMEIAKTIEEKMEISDKVALITKSSR
jgi:hypothetical protein